MTERIHTIVKQWHYSPLGEIMRTNSLLEELQAPLLLPNPEYLDHSTEKLTTTSTDDEPFHLSSSWALLS